eukprot:scaffold652652_cov94-Attheya_sp.AAC.1
MMSSSYLSSSLGGPGSLSQQQRAKEKNSIIGMYRTVQYSRLHLWKFLFRKHERSLSALSLSFSTRR